MEQYKYLPGFMCLKQIISIIVIQHIFVISALKADGRTGSAPLEFVEGQVIKVKNGTTIKLVCNFGNIPSLAAEKNQQKLTLNDNILWIKDSIGVISINGEVKISKEKYFNSFLFSSKMDVSYTLSIASLQKEDSGRYTCQNFDKSLMKYFDLVVLVPPSDLVIRYIVNDGKYLQEISNTYEQLGLIENDNIQLECSANYKGYPAVNFVWLKNGLFYSNQTRILLKNLTFHNHLNNFTCIVQTDALSEPIEIKVQLLIYFKPKVFISLNDYKMPMTKIDLNKYRMLENTNGMLKCKSRSNPPWTEIEWYKDGKFLTKDTDTVELKNLTRINSGKYQCRLKNQIGNGMHEIMLQVQYKPSLKMPANYTAIENTVVFLTCEIESVPNYFDVKWFRNDQELFINRTNLEDATIQNNFPDYEIKTNDTVSILRLFRIKSNDNNSKFTCAVNSTVNVSGSPRSKVLKNMKTTELKILFRPVIEKSADLIYFKPYDNVTLKCLARLNPTGQIMWYHNNSLININSHGKNSYKKLDYNENEYQQSVLNITKISENQTGVYKCFVKNDIGVAEHSISLINVDYRKPSPYDLNAKSVNFNSILLSWKINSNESGLEFQVTVNENEENLLTTKMHQILIENLTESTYHMFKVRCKYKSGLSEWSRTLNTTTQISNNTSEGLLMIKICTVSNDLSFKVNPNESCKDFLSKDFNPFFQNNIANIFILILVGIILTFVLMLCCSFTYMNCKRMKLNQRFKENILYSEQIKKRQAQLNYLNSITNSTYQSEKCPYKSPFYKQESSYIKSQPSCYSDDIQLSYFSSAKIMPIPEVNEESPKDSLSIDSFKNESETAHEQKYFRRDINNRSFNFSQTTANNGLNRYMFH